MIEADRKVFIEAQATAQAQGDIHYQFLFRTSNLVARQQALFLFLVLFVLVDTFFSTFVPTTDVPNTRTFTIYAVLSMMLCPVSVILSICYQICFCQSVVSLLMYISSRCPLQAQPLPLRPVRVLPPPQKFTHSSICSSCVLLVGPAIIVCAGVDVVLCSYMDEKRCAMTFPTETHSYHCMVHLHVFLWTCVQKFRQSCAMSLVFLSVHFSMLSSLEWQLF